MLNPVAPNQGRRVTHDGERYVLPVTDAETRANLWAGVDVGWAQMDLVKTRRC